MDRRFENLRRYAAEEEQYLARSSSRTGTNQAQSERHTELRVSPHQRYSSSPLGRSIHDSRSPSTDTRESRSESIETQRYRERSVDSKNLPIFITIQDYIPEPNSSNAIPLERGQIVEVLDNKNPTSWLVRTKSQPAQSGWVPGSYFETPADYYKRRNKKRELDESMENLSEAQKALLKREQVYHELLRSEEEFVSELNFVVDSYIKPMEGPNAPDHVKNLKEKLALNLREICNFHSNVLLRGLNYYSDDLSKVGKSFVRLERDFEHHVAFMRELPSLIKLIEADSVITNYLQNITAGAKARKTYIDYLKSIPARISQYEEFLKEIIKYTTQAQGSTNHMQKALELIQSIPKRAQEIEFTKNFVNYPGDIRRLGRLYRHDMFQVWEGDDDLPKDKYLFLFRNKLIFTDRDERHYSPTFKHYSTIRVNRFTVRQHTADPDTIVLRPNEPGLPSFRIKSKDFHSQEFIRQAWLKDINEMQEAMAAADEDSISQATESETLAISGLGRSSVFSSDFTSTSRKNSAHCGPEEGPPRKKIKSPPQISPTGSSTSLYSVGGGSSVEWSTTGTSLEMQGTRVTRTQYGFRTLQESSAKMCLKVTGYPLPDITWYKDDVLLKEDARHTFYSDEDGFFALTIDPVQVEDTGRYSCVATNEYGQASTSAFFRVLKVEKEAAPPSFVSGLADKQCREGEVVNFEVEVDGWPEPELVWLVDDQLLRPSHDFRIQYDGQKSKLEIRDAQSDDTGTYTVRITNEYGVVESKCRLTVEPDPDKNHIAPEFQAVIEDVDCEEGDTVKFKAVLTGDPDPEITWFVNGVPLTESEKIKFISEDGICILTIHDVTRHFDGIVTCQGKNRLGTSSCDARLRVRVPPVPPHFERPLDDRVVTENSAVMFEVDVIGYPEPKVDFFLKGQPLVHGLGGVEIKHFDGHYQVTIQNCQIDQHDGSIMARAVNDHGQAETRARLTVEPEEEESRSAPTFIKDLEDQTVKFGQEAVFDTVVRGFPNPTVSWFLNGSKLDSDTPGVVAIQSSGNEHKIILDSSRCAGTIMCRAENSIGRFETKSRLIVLPVEKKKQAPILRQPLVDKTETEGNTAVFEVTVDAEPAAQFKWTLNGQELTESDRFHFREFEGSSKLELLNCSLTDAGTLKCTAFNSEGEVSTQCQLKVNRKPKSPRFDQKPYTQQIEKGQEAMFEAHADASPEAEYQWSIGGRRIFPSVEGIKIEYDQISGISRLRVDTSIPLFSESATVSVMALNSYGSDECGARMIVVEPLPKFEEEPPPKKTRHESESDVSTDASQKTVATIKSPETVQQPQQVSVQEEAPKEPSVRNVAITQEPPTGPGTIGGPNGGVPRFEQELRSTTITEKESVEFKTVISGEPKPRIRWYINEKLVEAGEENTQIAETPAGTNVYEHSLKITESSSTKHSGQIRIVADNGQGSAQSTATLRVNQQGVESKPYFSKTPQDHEVYDTEESVKFSAIVHGNPTPIVHWYLKEEKIVSSEQIKMKHEVETGKTSIRVFQPKPEQSGPVRVYAENVHGSAQASAKLVVEKKPDLPRFITDLEDRQVGEGDTVKIEVKIEGLPEPEVSWTYNGEQISATNVKTYKEEKTHILEIKEVTTEQTGEYSCTAKNTAGLKRENFKLTVKETGVAPTFAQNLEDRLIEEHQTLVMEAHLASGIRPPPTVRWLRDNKVIESTDERWKITTEESERIHKLTVTRVEMTDKGRISIQAENKWGSAECSANVGVQQKRGFIGSSKPKFMSELGTITVSEGESLNAKVLISGEPAPYAKWFINNQMVYKTEDTEMTSEKGVYTMTIHGCTPDMTGTIKCVAGNKMGEATQEGKLVVIKPVPVEFETSLCDATCREGDTLRLKAVLFGEPMPVVTWYINGKKLEESQNIRIHAEKGAYMVTIKDITCDFSGLVVCEAVNEYGKASSQANLTVLPRGEPPDFIEWLANIRARQGSTVTHKVIYTGEPRPVITWFINNKEVKNSEEINIQTDEKTSVLTIKSFNPDKHVGEIICKAENDAGEVSCTANMATYTSDMFTESESASLAEEQREEFFEGIEDARQETFRTPTPIMAPAFITKIKDTRAQRGHQAIFECVVPDTKGVCCKWLKDGREIELIARIRVQLRTIEGFTTSELTIDDVIPEDSGKYTVIVSNEAGMSQCEANLTVVETMERPIERSPEFIVNLQDKIVKLSDKVSFECKVTSIPEAEIVWFHGDEKIAEEPDKIKIENDAGILKLTIEKAEVTDEGIYTCRAENGVGKAETSANLKVEVQPPEFTRPISDQVAQIGGQIVLECSVKGIPQPTVEFYTAHDNFRILTGTRVSIQHDITNVHWRLVISEVNERDFREYIAIAKNSVGEVQCRAKVEEAEMIEKPRIIEGLKRTTVRQSETAEMSIRIATDGPVPTVEWFKDGMPVQPDGRTEIVEIRDSGVYKLIIHNASPGDAGEYGVRVTNKAGTDQSKAPLIVEKELVPPQFIETLHDTSTMESQTATFSVVVTGKPEPEVKWTKDGTLIVHDGEHYVIKTEEIGHHSLSVRKVVMTDAGTFSCEAFNEAGTATTSGNFSVIEDLQPPKFTKELESIEIREEESATFSVTVEGRPEPVVDWFKDGRPIQIDEEHVVKRVESKGHYSIVINKAKLEDAGIFSCKAVNKAGADETSARLGVIESDEAPKFTEGLKSIEVKQGETVEMAVVATGKPNPEVQWFKDGQPVQIDGEHIVRRDEVGGRRHSITIKDARLEDAGVFTCKAVNKAGSDETSANLAVIEALEPPKFIDGLKPLEVGEGDSAKMSVTVTGKPEPEVDWFKDGRPVQIDGDHIVVSKGPQQGQHTLTVKAANLADAGVYSCKAVNKVGTDETSANFGVIESLEAPKFTEGLTPVEIKEGENVTMSVVVEGKPEPEIQWFKDQQPIQIDGEHVVRKDGPSGRHSITINDAKLIDAGFLTCKAINKAGSDETSAKFGVIEDVQAPKFTDGLTPFEVQENETTIMSVTVTGKPEPNVEWYKDGRPVEIDGTHIITSKGPQPGQHSLTLKNANLLDAGVYSCTATNKAGSDETKAQFGVIESLEAPKFIDGLAPTEVKEGETAQMSVTATGKPEPEIQWFKDGRPIEIDGEHVLRRDEGKRHSITIKDARLADAGILSCKAVNKVGTDETRANFAVVEDLQPPHFVERLGELEIEQGQSAKLECRVVGKPEPEIRWFLNGQPINIDGSHFITRSEGDGRHTLVVNNANSSDAGTYSCEAVNKAGRDETSGLLKFPKYVTETREEEKAEAIEVEAFKPEIAKEVPTEGMAPGPPEFIELLKSATTTIGGTAVLRCKVKGFPRPTITWSKQGGAVITESERIHLEYHDDGVIILTLKDTIIQDTGEYRCEAENDYGSAWTEGPIIVALREDFPKDGEAPDFLEPVRPVTVKVDETAVLEGKVCGNPFPSIKWYKGGEEITHNPRYKVENLPDGTQRLTVPNCQMEDMDDYRCEATNKHGDVWSDVTLTVQAPVEEEPSMEAPTVIKALEAIAAREGEPFELECAFKGVPPPEIKWYKDSAEIKADDSHFRAITKPDGTAKLSVPAAAMADAGIFRCEAKNPAGTARTEAPVTVLPADLSSIEPTEVAPEFLQELKPVQAKEGEPASFECKVAGTPAPEVKWYKDGQEIRPSDKVHMETGPGGVHRLIIDNCGLDDQGNYRVEATNPAGTTSSKAPLTVLPSERLKLKRGLEDQEVPVGCKIQLSVEVEGHPKTVKWYHGNEELSESETTKIRQLTDEEYSLQIENAQLKDSGTFRVVLSTDTDSVESFCKVTVIPQKPTAPTFRKGLEDQCLPKGSKLELEVEVDGQPDEVKWLKDGKPIDETSGAKMEDLGGGRYKLTIPELGDDQDFGNYSVRVSNPGGTAESSAKITEKEEKPEIVSGLKPLRVKPGETAAFEVQTKKPVREVKWYKNGKLMENPTTEQPDATHFRLFIPSASLDDEAEYKVVLSNPAGSAESAAPLTVVQPIRFLKPLEDKTVKHGEAATLDAETDRPPKVVRWYKNGDEIKPEGAKVGPGNKISLQIPEATDDDAGNYTVVVEDDDGATADSSAVLTVLIPPSPTESAKPPRFIRPLCDQTIPEEDELVLEVEIDNNPHTVKWYRNGEELTPGTANMKIEKLNDETFRLTIPKSKIDDSGNYEVEAINDYGSAECAAKIIVEPAPEFLRPLRDLDVVEGELAQFDCLTNLRHPPRIVCWYKNGVEIKSDNRIEMSSEEKPEGTEYRLLIKWSTKDDIGTYKIRLENSAGSAESLAKLQVHSAKKEPPKITRGLIDQIVAEGEPIVFEIDVEGDVDEIKWLKDGQPIAKTGRGEPEKVGDKTYRLTIPSSEASDAGHYEVQAINSGGKATSEAKAEVDLPPKIVKGLIPAEIDEGDEHLFRVEVSTNVRDVKWYKNGQEIKPPLDARIKLKEVSPKKYELEISNAKLDDIADYKVVLSNKAGFCESSAELKVNKPSILKILQGLSDIDIDESEPLELVCKIEGTPAAVKWFKNGQEVSPDERVQLKSDPDTGVYSLLIPNSLASDGAAYRVVFLNPKGGEISSGSIAHVRTKKPEVVTKGPFFLSPLEDVTVEEGETVTLKCQVDGEPLPSVKWFREGSELTPNDRVSIRLALDGNAVLKIRDSKKADAGQFQVVATNEVGSAESSCQVRVLSGDELPCAPKFIIPLKRTEGTPGANAEFNVKVKGIPEPELTWFLNGAPLPTDGRFKVEPLGDGCYALTISDIRDSDFGTLRCVATNNLGKDECEAAFEPSADWLEKQKEKEGYPPRFNVPLWDRKVPLGKLMFIECHVDANPRADITWTKDGAIIEPSESEGIEIENTPDGACRLKIAQFLEKHVGEYKCQATNKYGTADTRANLGVEIEEPEAKVEEKGHAPKFNPGLEDVTINAGEKLKLYCRVIAVPAATITFYKDGIPLIQTDNLQIDYDESSGDCTLTIPNTGSDDTGAYRCVANNKHGSTNTACQVTVRSKKEEAKKEGAEPFFTKGLVDQYIDKGDTLVFTCAVTGDPSPETKWYKDGIPLKPSNRIEIEQTPDGQCKLTVKDAQISDEGIYRCEATNPLGTAKTQATAHVDTTEKIQKPKEEIGEPPRFIIPLEDLTVFIGSSIELECKVSGVPMPTLKWTKDGRPLIEDARFEWDNNPANGTYKLKIRDSTGFDEGTYRAVATNESGQATSKASVTIDEGALKKAVKPEGAPPTIAVKLQDVRVTEGQPLKLHCRITGDPKPSIVWYKDGEPVQASERLQLEEDEAGNAYLIIPSCTLADDGIYRVIATNEHGSAYDKCTAYVKKAPTEEAKKPEAGFDANKAPKVVMPLENVRVPEKDEFVLRCKFSGEPKLAIKWYKDGERVFPYDHIQLSELDDGTCELRVPSALKSDAGSYRCIAENPYGTAQTSCTVSVQPKERRPKDIQEQIKEMGRAPGFIIPLTVKHAKPGDTVTFECLPYGNPFPEIKWLKDGIEIEPNEGIKIEASPDGTQRLILRDVDFPSEGTFRCVATNEHGTASTKAELILHGDRKAKPAAVEEDLGPKESKPRIRPGLYNQNVHQGRPVEMQICALGFPTPTVQWFKDGKPVEAEGPDSRTTIYTDERGIHHLVILSAQPDDEGEYSVIATNPLGEASSSGTLGVIRPREVEPYEGAEQRGAGHPPGFIRQIKNKHVFSKMPTIFDCLVTGDPKPEVEWYHNGKLIVPDERIKIQACGGSPNTGWSHALLIQDTCLEDAGEYVVIARNTYGSASSSAILDVTVPFLDKIKFDGSIDVTPYLVEEYGFKKQQFRSIPTPPDRGPFIKEVTGHYLTLSWIPTKRSPPRYPQVTYIVEIRELPYKEWSLLDYNIPEPVCKVRNLELGKSYQFRVRAENIYGVSEPSPPSPPSRLMARPPPVLDRNKRVIPLLDPYAERALDLAHAEQYACTPFFAPGVQDKRSIGENETASITLCFSGYPDPQITWKHRGMDIDSTNPASNVRISTRSGSDTTITFLAFKKDNAGQYTCVAKNQYGEAQQNLLVDVATRPKFMQGLTDQTFYTEKPGKLDVRIEGSPFPEVKWLKDWRPLAESSRIHFVQDGPYLCSLVIDQPIWGDSGIYSCIAINEAGQSVTSCLVNIEADFDTTPISRKKITLERGDAKRIYDVQPKTNGVAKANGIVT